VGADRVPADACSSSGVGGPGRLIYAERQPIEIAIGPPAFHACPNVVNVRASTEMMVERDREIDEAAPGAGELLPVAQLGQHLLVAIGVAYV
jgi:hypothetical protein